VSTPEEQGEKSRRGAAVELRPEVSALPAYVPGARPLAGAKVHKLSSNENPYPPLPSVLDRLHDVLAEFHRYPDLAAVDLVQALARRLSGDAVASGAAQPGEPAVLPENLVVGNGSVAVLSHILDAVVRPGDEVVYPWRSFEAYPIAVAIAGGEAVEVPLAPDASLDVDALAAAVTPRTRAVVVCTPNNPTGPAVTHTEVLRLLAAVPRDVLVLVDEAYLEFVRQDDAVDGVALLVDHPNVVLLRTFSKAYGLAGLRVGYAVASAELAAGIRAVTTPFGVSAVAQAAAVASLEARDELFERVERIVRERDRVLAALRDQGWPVPDSQANFVWFPVGDAAVAFAQAASERGLLVRPFAGDGVRVSIGDEEANDVLLDFASQVAERFLQR